MPDRALRRGDELCAVAGRRSLETPRRHGADEIVVIEVMAEKIDRPWWSELRKRLMLEFRQKDIIIRAHAAERLT